MIEILARERRPPEQPPPRREPPRRESPPQRDPGEIRKGVDIPDVAEPPGDDE